jgi:lipoprotein-anchoring transpeptidase ErfK/SrfK
MFTVSLFGNFFVLDNGIIVEIVNEPNKNIEIVGSNGKILKKHSTLKSVKQQLYKNKKRYGKKKKISKKRVVKKRKIYKKKRYTKKRIIKKYKKRRKNKYITKKLDKKRVSIKTTKSYKKKIKDMIVIRSSKKILEFYQNGKFKKLYKVAVGKDGWRVYGKFWVRKKVKWPNWVPTKRIKEENPNLPDIVYGGPKNPLGARALYLGYSAVRIHGTNNPKSIGKAVSHGCFRMKNEDIIELYSMVKVGTPVYIK